MAAHNSVGKYFALNAYSPHTVPQTNTTTTVAIPSPAQHSDINSSSDGGSNDQAKKNKKHKCKKKNVICQPSNKLPTIKRKKLKSSSSKLAQKNELRDDGKRGKKVVHEQGREIIGNIIKFFEEEKRKKGLNVPLNQPLRRAAEATGISYSTIKRIKKEVQRCEETGTKLTTPGQFRRGRKSIYEIEQMKNWTSGWTFNSPVPFSSTGLRGFIYKEIQTDDKLIYQFHPISSGSLHFKVKAANDAHIALTTAPREGDSMYEIVIGGWGNTKSAIRKNRLKTEHAIIDTLNILVRDEFKGFWVRWAGGNIALGHEGEGWPFLSWDDPEPFPVGYYGVCTGWGSSGHWIVEGCVGEPSTSTLSSIISPPQCRIAFPQHQPPTQHQSPMQLQTQTPAQHQPSTQHQPPQHQPPTQQPSQALHASPPQPLEPDPSSCTPARTNQLMPGVFEMVIEPTLGWNVANSGSGSAHWIPASNGAVPPNAVKGCFDKIEQLYVGRAHHDGATIPGKIVPSHGMCYIAWRGVEHGKPDYEVLCDCAVSWIPASGGIIPEGALPAGATDTGETLFVGRTIHQGTTVVGMVQPSHKVCYIPFNSLELPYGDYEVLVAK